MSDFRDPRYEVFLRENSTFIMYDRLDVWENFIFIPRFNDVGTWNLEVPTYSRIASRITPTTGIVVKRDGATIFSGSAGTDYIETSKVIKMSGKDDNQFLLQPARPTPSLDAPPYPDAYDVTTGVASTIMISLVNRNIGTAAPAAYKINNLIFAADPVVGGVLTARARFDPLLTLLKELAATAIAGGLGFRILQSDLQNDKIEFQIYSPEDKHLDVVFSTAIKTANDYEWSHQEPDANYFIVGGGDNFGLNRTIVEGGDATSIAAIGRRAVFVDRRGVEDTSELEQELAELIAGTVTVDTITVDPAPVPSLKYGEDYNLGDYVSATVKGVTYERIIREVEHEYSPTLGMRIKPMVADPGGSNDDTLARHLSSLEGRISNIERNWTVPNDSITEDMTHPYIKWLPGDIKLTGRGSAQDGWLICNGSAISRSTYSRLFAAIGEEFGVGNGSTTFNIPNFMDRFPMGAGSSYARGDGGGSFTPTITVSGSHSHGMKNHTHTSQAHTHPHSHGLDAHRHHMDHTHEVDNGPSSTSTRQDGGNAVASSTHDHDETSAASNVKTGDGELTSGGSAFSTTQSDSNGATYSGSPSGPNDNSTDSDSNPYSGMNTIIPQFCAVYYEIYYGPIP